MPRAGQLSLAIHIKAEVSCATPGCWAEHSQQIFIDPETSLEMLGKALEQRSLEAVESLGWGCIDNQWYCADCLKAKRGG